MYKKTEQRLIEEAQSGNTVAFDRLVNRYQKSLYRLMMRACNHPQDAEEVVYDAFARAYERLEQFEGRSSFITWIGRIATNICIRRREKNEIQSFSLDDISTDHNFSQTPQADQPTPEESAIQSELRSAIYSAISNLHEPDRTILQMRDLEDMSVLTICNETGLTMPAVKARLHRARQRLRTVLNQQYFDSV